MALQTNNLNRSIVDFLKSKGFKETPGEALPFFSQRKKLYEQNSLKDTFGDYKGSASQNTALLRLLESQNLPNNTNAVVQPTQTPTSAQTTPTSENKAINQPIETPQVNNEPITASGLLTMVQNRPDIQLAQQITEEQKKSIDAGIPGEQERVRQASAEAGTTFSPRFTDQPVQAVEAAALAKKLGVDEKFAGIILNALEAEAKKVEEANKPITLSEGASLIDPKTKQVIYKAPKTVQEEHSAIYKEWQDAVNSGYTGSFIDYQNEDANRKRPISNTYIGDYSGAQRTAITRINDSVSKNDTYAKTSSMRTFGQNVLAALSLGTGIGDIAAINQFQKVIDEGAVTRDQDVKLVQASQSLINQLKTQIARLEKGEQLSQTQRDQMKQLVTSMYNAQLKALSSDSYIQAKIKEADLNNIDLNDTILGDLQTGFVMQGASNDVNNSNTGSYTPVDLSGINFKIVQ